MWLGVYFDRKISFHNHMRTLSAKAIHVANGLRFLEIYGSEGRTGTSPPPRRYHLHTPRTVLCVRSIVTIQEPLRAPTLGASSRLADVSEQGRVRARKNKRRRRPGLPGNNSLFLEDGYYHLYRWLSGYSKRKDDRRSGLGRISGQDTGAPRM